MDEGRRGSGAYLSKDSSANSECDLSYAVFTGDFVVAEAACQYQVAPWWPLQADFQFWALQRVETHRTGWPGRAGDG